MAPIRSPVLNRIDHFTESLAALSSEYPQIEETIKELEELIRCDFLLPEIPVSATEIPNVYAIRMDYPPLGERGIGHFLITYHATQPTPSPALPYYTITMLTIQAQTSR